LLLQLEADGCCVAAFADDLPLLVEGDSRAALERLGTQYVQYCTDWGMRVDVKLSRRKTEYILLKRSLSLSRPPNIRLGDGGVGYTTSVRHLGIFMGERMNFRPYLDYLYEKVLSVVNTLRRVMRREWGLGRKATGIIYTGLFVACISYGARVCS